MTSWVRVIKPQFYMWYMHYLFWLNRSNRVLLLQGKQKTWMYTRQGIVQYDGEGKVLPCQSRVIFLKDLGCLYIFTYLNVKRISVTAMFKKDTHTHTHNDSIWFIKSLDNLQIELFFWKELNWLKNVHILKKLTMNFHHQNKACSRF